MSSERIDHAAEARLALEWLSRAGENAIREHGPLEVAAAQAHATLALVEQMRIANVIALMDSPRTATSVAREAERTLMQGEPVVNRELRPDIAAALGIEVADDD